VNNVGKIFDAIQLIFKALSDGQWHRNMEIHEKTKISSRTLTKHLDRMAKTKIMEKKIDKESGKYPYPVLYRLNPKEAEFVQCDMIILLLSIHNL
jgi:DNA-binding HxlR family transcriptional regulator